MYFQGIISLNGIFWVWDFFFSKCIWILKINLENEWHGSLKAKRTKQKVVFGMRHFTSMHTYLIQIKDQFLILFLKMKSSKQYWYTLKLSRIGCCVFFFFFLGSGMSDTIIPMISWSLQEAVIAELYCLIWYQFLLNHLGIW